MVKITNVENRSSAKKCGILKDDILVSVNGNDIHDVLDYRFYLTEENVELVLLRGALEYSVKIKKGEYDDIGLEFETPLMDEKHSCKNGCIFCFIDQNPKGLRDSLYFKDDDSRLSFIHGNYITLTNMQHSDIDRIIKMRFSPLNISIHTTNPDLRRMMMKNKRSGEVLSYLQRIKDAGLSMCGQIVLCRGINDGEELMRTMHDLAEYYPSLGSVAIVPAGLTRFRDGLYPLSAFTEEEASGVIDMINAFGDEMYQMHGERVFFASDEFYLRAGREIPGSDFYEGYPQIENGVGMLRSFMDEFDMAYSDIQDMGQALLVEREVSIATGAASFDMILHLSGRIMSICPNLKINVYKIVNNFFGESITVSGLLTGHDILEQLKDKELGELLLIPENALRKEERDFLCGMTLDELSASLNVGIMPSECDGYEFVRALLGAE